MKVIIAGLGKVGYAIARQLEGEQHDLTIIDIDTESLERADNSLDVICVQGNGASVSTLLEAGVREADLMIAVTQNDEENLICCLMAKKLGARHTVARVRSPEYFRDAPILRREVGLDMIINPEYAAAQDAARMLRVPSAFSVESFAGGLVELIGFQITERDSIAGRSLVESNRHLPARLLLCAAKRGEEIIVPNGNFVPLVGDRVYAIGTPKETGDILRAMGRPVTPVRRVSVLGGGRIALYLAWALESLGMRICIVEEDEERCRALSSKLPKAVIIHGDGTDRDLLESEGIFDCDAFLSLTGQDEVNLLMALSAQHAGVGKVLPKMSRPNYTDIVHRTGVDAVISPKDVTAAQIASFVRAIANSQGSAVERLHKILDGSMEAVEFTATSATHFLNTPLRQLYFRQGMLVAAIVHEGKMLIPNGDSAIYEGDRVIVVAKSLFLKDLNDILEC